MRVSEIRVKQIRVNQGLGVHKYLTKVQVYKHFSEIISPLCVSSGK